MVRPIVKAGIACACLLMLAVFVPQAHAGSIDFACGTPATNICTGTVVSGGRAFTTTSPGIGMQSSFDGTETFMASFTIHSSGMGEIQVADGDGDSIYGNIVTTTEGSIGGDETLTFNVNWNAGFGTISSALGNSQSTGQSTVTFMLSNGTVERADLHIKASAPEPSTLLLLGTGLLGVGFAFRRMLAS